jgi:hypothetical protein
MMLKCLYICSMCVYDSMLLFYYASVALWVAFCQLPTYSVLNYILIWIETWLIASQNYDLFSSRPTL